MNDLKNALRPLNSAMMVGQTSTVKVLHEMRKRGHIDHAIGIYPAWLIMYI